MLRIVVLTIKPSDVDTFRSFFEENQMIIKNFPGCNHLELLQDINHSNVFYTYSIWEDEVALNEYRDSIFFKEVWSSVKPLFDKKPKAYSMTKPDAVY